MPAVTPVAKAYVLIEDDGSVGTGTYGAQRGDRRHVYLCIEDAAGNQLRYEIPHVIGIEYNANARRGRAEASLLLERARVEVRIPVGVGHETTVEDLLSEIAAANLVDSKS